MDSFYSELELQEIGFKALGKNVKLSRKAMVYNAEKISIGNDVRIDDFCILSGQITFGNFIHIAVCTRLSGSTGGLTIRDFAGVSYNCTVIASSDDYSGEFLTNPTVPLKYKKLMPAPVVLERHSLIASHCFIGPGVTIGEGTAVGAMSMVLKSLEPWSIYVGIPARRLKDRKRNLLELEKQFLAEHALESGQ